MMSWFRVEYVLKGLFLGLLAFVAIHARNWSDLRNSALICGASLALFLSIAAYQKSREGYSPKGKPLAFVLFLLLESPELVYAGVLAGIALSAFALFPKSDFHNWLLAGFALGGGAAGAAFGLVRYVPRKEVRIAVSFIVAAIAVGGALLYLGQFGRVGEELGISALPGDRSLLGAQLLIGIPLFYLLAFSGKEEESEVEIGALCAALALGISLMGNGQRGLQTTGFIISLGIYFWYSTRVLPRLRVFKHALRGLSYSQLGRYKPAIVSFRRALEHEPQNAMAREGLWAVHRALDPHLLANDSEVVKVLDFAMCIDRAGSLLLQGGPSQASLEEAHRLLDMVNTHKPEMRPVMHYWRAVAYTHQRLFDQACDELREILDPTGYLPDDPWRRGILLQAWQLAGRLHPELARRLGTPQLAIPARRMEAIIAAERHLQANPEDADTWAFKQMLYEGLTEADFGAGKGTSPAAGEFDYAYTLQLGQRLIAGDQLSRACDYLRIAACGMPERAPGIFTSVAQAYQRAGQPETAWNYYELAQRAGRAIGAKNLDEENRLAYFGAVKLLADVASKHNLIDTAIENYHLYLEYERSGLETLRALADLYERKGDPLAALRFTEEALIYNAKEKDLLERKDRYYYSVLPEDLKARLDWVRGCFDTEYCLKKAKTLLDAKAWDLDTLDWAEHLAHLVAVVKPEDLASRLLIARARLRRGEKQEAVALLEQVRSPKPEKFASGTDEDAWYVASKLLGEIYLGDLGRPDLAIPCLKDFRQSSKSGADTIYKLGQAYEQIGDVTRAVRFYKHVVSYESHPLALDARDALSRLQAK
jgi:tetratricopeptide (TPR) repeat protein